MYVCKCECGCSLPFIIFKSGYLTIAGGGGVVQCGGEGPGEGRWENPLSLNLRPSKKKKSGKGNKGEGENHPIPITTWMCVIADWWVDRQPTPSRAKGLAFERMRLD